MTWGPADAQLVIAHMLYFDTTNNRELNWTISDRDSSGNQKKKFQRRLFWHKI